MASHVRRLAPTAALFLALVGGSVLAQAQSTELFFSEYVEGTSNNKALETGGCSCTQIVDALGLGQGHRKFGCSLGVMRGWVAALP